jgi:hypothetical protein
VSVANHASGLVRDPSGRRAGVERRTRADREALGTEVLVPRIFTTCVVTRDLQQLFLTYAWHKWVNLCSDESVLLVD